MAESKEIKSLLRKVRMESEKAGIKFNIQKTKIMASSPITSWKTDGKTMQRVRDYFLGLQNHCSHEIKRFLLLGRKAMTNIDSVLKSRNKVPIGAWVYFWAFYLVPLVYISGFVQVPYWLDECSFVV